jgi:DNA-binding response OmpR family regulator
MTTLEHSLAPNSTSGCVLVVDDNDRVRRLLSLALETGGFRVVEAASEHEAQRRLADTRPDILVLNLQRSAADGLDLLRQVRACPQFVSVPVIFLAGCGDDDLRWRAMRAGADWFALRPIGMVELQHRVRGLFDRGRPRLRAIAGAPRRGLPIRHLKAVG